MPCGTAKEGIVMFPSLSCGAGGSYAGERAGEVGLSVPVGRGVGLMGPVVLTRVEVRPPFGRPME